MIDEETEVETETVPEFDWDAYYMDKLDCQREEELDNE
jgi:hypothetical protein